MSVPERRVKARATRGKPREHRINLSPDHWSNTHLTTLNIDFDNQESSSSLQPNESSQSPESSSTPKSVLDVLAAAGFDASTYPNHHTIYGLPSPMEHYPPYRLNILFDALSSQCNLFIRRLCRDCDLSHRPSPRAPLLPSQTYVSPRQKRRRGGLL
ncbi:hypothetical protein EX30DRAFT_339528 [Ascodesmis nigricans]|uniref:Uncharacterized protein n=1 Tax=Ascodesmis nigricans TaxID=341454 RepID=A0A4S2N2J3_9PEZI|nr:hypothetical protein EX30DRAFT_339528 [Ascodesmis nigricans]